MMYGNMDLNCLLMNIIGITYPSFLLFTQN